MLPSLTLAFIIGLVLGSFVPYFPLSVSIVLGLAVIGSAVLETRQRVSASRATAGFFCLLLGIVYWSLVVEGSSRPPVDEFDELHEFRGRIVAPVQLAPDRMVMLVKLDQSSERSDQPRVIRLTWR